MNRVRRLVWLGLLLAQVACGAPPDPVTTPIAHAPPSTSAAPPMLAPGVLVVMLRPAVEGLPLDQPATIVVDAQRAPWSRLRPAWLEGLSTTEPGEVRVEGPYLVEPATFTPSPKAGTQLDLRAIPYRPWAPRPPWPTASPVKDMELDLTSPGVVGVRWMQGSVVVGLSELPRTTSGLREGLRKQWEQHRNFVDPADPNRDRAFVYVPGSASVASITLVLEALLSVTRRYSVPPAGVHPAFAITISAPPPPTKLVVDDEIDLAALRGHGAPLRTALERCGVARCSPDLRARLLMQLGEVLVADAPAEAEQRFLDARAIAPDARADGRVASSAPFQAARRHRLPEVRTATVMISGRIQPDVVRAGVDVRKGFLRQCYVDGLRRDPGLRGRVAVRFVIGLDGSVSTITKHDGDIADAPTVGCLLAAFEGLVYPRLPGGIATVTWALLLSP